MFTSHMPEYEFLDHISSERALKSFFWLERSNILDIHGQYCPCSEAMLLGLSFPFCT
jgi:hypothetical protein